MLKSIVVVAGAALQMAEAGVIGYLLHRMLLDQVPGVAAWIPRDGGAVLGLAIGAAIVASWAVG